MCEKLNLGNTSSGKGEKIMAEKTNSILADAMEAVIGSLYLDGGLSAAENFIMKFLDENIKKAINGTLFVDFKTKLQEEVQKKGTYTVNYVVLKENGPDHNKTFTTAVLINDTIMGKGIGKTKKEAEQNAAGDALEKWFNRDNPEEGGEK